MLVKLTDIKGKEVWINPLYVKAVASKGNDGAEVFVTYGSAWSQVTSIKVKAPAADVAAAISAAMPDAAAYMAAVATDEELRMQQEQAQRAAAMGG